MLKSFVSNAIWQKVQDKGKPLNFKDHIRESDLEKWPFSDPPWTTVYVEETLADGERDVQIVLHDEDGFWQILDISQDGPGIPELMCFHCVVERHDEVKQFSDLPVGWMARRTGDGWHRMKAPPLED